MKPIICFYFFLSLFNFHVYGKKLDLQKIENLIFVKCNLEREKHRLSPYEYSTELAHIAKYHSSNMATYHFFSHVDKKRMSPQNRMGKFYPKTIAGVGENIAINFGLSEEELADNLVKAWMNSPGHRANILSKQYDYVGHGVEVNSDRSKANIDKYYATQNFGRLVAKFTGKLPLNFRHQSKIRLPFEFLGKHPKDELYIYITYPNKSYKHYVKSTSTGYSYYTGGGPYTPQWTGDNQFEIHLDLDKGIGEYAIKMGKNNRFYQKAIVLKVN